MKENGNKVYVYPPSFKSYTEGQWVEVFPKGKDESLADAIKRVILPTNSPTDCLVTSNPPNLQSKYPQNYKTAVIGVPSDPNDDLSTLGPKWEKCHEPYVTENGISYFLEDTNHPDRFVYFSIGQYPISSGRPNQVWQDTISFTQ